MMKLAITFLLLALSVQLCVSDPLIKVFCSGSPLFRGRADQIVSPGVVSGHIHKVAGGSNFGIGSASQSNIDVYNDIKNSPCTTCSIPGADNSVYWHPDLYYQWPNGSYSLVPKGGLTIYYLARGGSGSQTKPAWKAFPPGFRMVSGNPFRRTYNPDSVADRAINFACLSEPGGPETNDFPTKTRFCKNGLRMQVHFPQCWDGVNLDSSSHTSHVAFPIERPDGGNCPSTHPVRIPDLFFEAFYTVDQFPHGDGTRQPFVLACGDATGYGFHGDFLNGWDQQILQNVFTNADGSCDQVNTNNGNSPEKCSYISQYVKGTPSDGACSLSKNIPLNENMGIVNAITKLPGCNAVTGYSQTAPICSSPPSATEKADVAKRFHLKSVSTGKYWSCPPVNTNPLTALAQNEATFNYYHVFSAQDYPGGYVSLRNEGPTNQYLSASGNNNAVLCNRGTASDWEAFQFVAQTGGNVAVIAKRNGQYLTANSDGTVTATSTTIGTAQLWTRTVPAGGAAF